MDRMKELVQKQGGDTSYIEDLGKFENAPIIAPVISDTDGLVEELDAGKVFYGIPLEYTTIKEEVNDEI